MHLAVLLWGFTGVLGRAISLDAVILVWYRMLLTAAFMLVILLVGKQWVTVPGKDVKRLAIIGGLMGIHWVAFYASIKYANASIALICLSTASIFTSIIEPLVTKTRYKPKELALGLMALAGMCLIYQFQKLFVTGIVFGVIAAILSSVFTVLNKQVSNKYPARTIVFYEMSTGFVVISLFLAIWISFHTAVLWPRQIGWKELMADFPANLALHNDWIWLVIMALCCTVWAQTLSISALKKLSSFTTTLTVNLEPVYGIILAIIFFREDQQLSWGFFAGMGLICLSVILQMTRLLRGKTID